MQCSNENTHGKCIFDTSSFLFPHTLLSISSRSWCISYLCMPPVFAPLRLHSKIIFSLSFSHPFYLWLCSIISNLGWSCIVDFDETTRRGTRPGARVRESRTTMHDHTYFMQHHVLCLSSNARPIQCITISSL